MPNNYTPEQIEEEMNGMRLLYGELVQKNMALTAYAEKLEKAGDMAIHHRYTGAVNSWDAARKEKP